MTSLMAKPKILAVDDNPENIWPLLEILEPDYEIITATSGEKALHIAAIERHLDLVLLDIMMPGMDGFEVCEKLKASELTRDIPIIFITSKNDELEETKGLEIGAQDFISKPFSLPIIRARIKSALNLKKEKERRLLLKAQLEELNRQLETQVQQKMRELKEARETLRTYEEKYTFLFKEKQTPRTRKTILVVDDTPENIHILVENLEGNYNIVYATNGVKALEIVHSDNPPDLILLDIMMPGMDGYEVCARLKADTDTWDIPVIFVTALNQETDETKGFQLGAVDFVTKPFSIPVVDARIKAALRLKEEMDNRVIMTNKLESLNRNLEARIQERTAQLEHANESLKQSERKYRTIFENAIEGIFQSTPQGKYLSVNPSCAKLLGYDSPRDMQESIADIGTQVFRFPEDRLKFMNILEKDERIYNFEAECIRKNGESIWLSICASLVRDDSGAISYYQGLCTDISARKKAEEELIHGYDTQSIINTLLHLSMSDVSLNELLGTALDLILGLKWLPVEPKGSIFLIDDEKYMVMKASRGISPTRQKFCRKVTLGDCLCARAAESGVIVYSEHDGGQCRISNLEPGHYIHYCIPILSAGVSMGVLSLQPRMDVYHDSHNDEHLKSIANTLAAIIERRRMAEERERMETKLRQSQKMEAIGALAGGIAHDFNNILTALLGYLEIAHFKLAPTNPLNEDLGEIRRAALRAADLVKQILTFSRKTEKERKPLKIDIVVREAIKLLRASIPTTIEFAISVDHDCGYVLADPTQIHQVIMNLCTNAYHAMRENGGVLTIELSKETLENDDPRLLATHSPGGHYLRLRTKDTGNGMDQSTKDRIFEPYFTTKKKGEGTGLGLAVVHGIVKSHHGFVIVESEPGKGSTFDVYLPTTSSISIVPAVEKENMPEGGTEHLLVVDDEKPIVDMAQILLTTYGYKVTAMTEAEAALQMFRENPRDVDLVITDFTMPSMTGAEFSRRLMEIRPDIPIILCTGFSDQIDGKKAEKLGIKKFILKPFVPQQLLKTLRLVLDGE